MERESSLGEKWRRYKEKKMAAVPDDPEDDISEDEHLKILMGALRQRLYAMMEMCGNHEFPLHDILLRPLRDDDIARFQSPMDLWIHLEFWNAPPLLPEQLRGLARRMVEACLEIGIVCHICQVARPGDVGQEPEDLFYIDAYPALASTLEMADD